MKAVELLRDLEQVVSWFLCHGYNDHIYTSLMSLSCTILLLIAMLPSRYGPILISHLACVDGTIQPGPDDEPRMHLQLTIWSSGEHTLWVWKLRKST